MSLNPHTWNYLGFFLIIFFQDGENDLQSLEPDSVFTEHGVYDKW